MEIYRKYLIVILCFAVFQSNGQVPDTIRNLYEFKLDYNVPESPAFSVLDANPTKVMRSNAGQELVVNVASSFISGSGISPGLAVDVNPYFVLGGRLDNVKEYRENYGKRLLANIQLSFATIDSKVFPNDMLFSSGIKINLFDTKDMVFDKQLGVDIDKALAVDIPDPIPGQPILEPKILENALLETAYENAKKRYMEAKGGSMSLGYAIAGRAKDNKFITDSIATYRHQAWLVGQYDFGVSQFSLNGMVMYRYEQGNMLASEDGIITGIALRHYGKKLILSGEIIYEGLKEEIQFGGYIEVYLMKNISIYASLSQDESTTDSGIIFKPGIKWNLSEN